MDHKTFSPQRPFAGDKVPSMTRRCAGYDYTQRRIYMITMVTEGRRRLFGQIVGDSEAPKASDCSPHILLSPLGEAVAQNWNDIPKYHPEISVLSLQMMPDHLHGILFVERKLSIPLGKVLLGFKQGCNKAYREFFPKVEYAAVSKQPTRDHGLLFQPNFNDKILWRKGELQAWKRYLEDNPRRLLVKRQHPDYFQVRHSIQAGGHTFDAIGNLFLLQHPSRLQIKCSRRLTDPEIEAQCQYALNEASQGAVLVSPSISKGEKIIMRAAYEKGYPLILLQENGLTPMSKPHGRAFEACSRGQMLILAPWQHHNEHLVIQRSQCLQLNDMAHDLSTY